MPRGQSSFDQTLALSRQLTTLGERVQEEEAQALAGLAVTEARQLAAQYRVVRPPWLHNVLVNYGMRERGLCFEWTNDLFLRLHELDLHSINLHLAVARMDTRREHNAIVATADGQPFETGLVLDAWRGSGMIWSGPVTSDKYPWEPLPPDRLAPEIQKVLQGRQAGFTPAGLLSKDGN
jgi:hypothetical protein